MKRRYVAPLRADIDRRVFAHPIFAGFAQWLGWCEGVAWPDISALNDGIDGARHAYTGHALRFVAQTPKLLADGLHYEARIHERGEIATRLDNWHDLLNAMVWCRFPAIKSALNVRQHADILCVGGKQRTPAQYAQTLFDEGGALVTLRDSALVEMWNRHAWAELFDTPHWCDGRIQVELFGHALLEHALTPGKLITAKCLVWHSGSPLPGGSINSEAAAMIAAGRWLNDPQELRPLPLSGIPGWHAQQDGEFYLHAECFRPVRAGREYPLPATIPLSSR